MECAALIDVLSRNAPSAAVKPDSPGGALARPLVTSYASQRSYYNALHAAEQRTLPTSLLAGWYRRRRQIHLFSAG